MNNVSIMILLALFVKLKIFYTSFDIISPLSSLFSLMFTRLVPPLQFSSGGFFRSRTRASTLLIYRSRVLPAGLVIVSVRRRYNKVGVDFSCGDRRNAAET